MHLHEISINNYSSSESNPNCKYNNPISNTIIEGTFKKVIKGFLQFKNDDLLSILNGTLGILHRDILLEFGKRIGIL